MRNNTQADAQNKWRGILSALGFTELQLSDKHQPCPICEGKDRYRFTDYKGGGEYYCSGCGPGAGFDLLMKTNDWEFGYAAKQVDKILGTDVKEVFQPKVDVEKRRRDLNSCWKRAAENPWNFRDYLISRGISNMHPDMLQDIRGTDDAYLTGSNQRHRCMIALVRNKNGEPVSIHRTYPDDKIRKMMPPTEKITGAAIRLGMPVGDELVVGEGIETTLSGMMRYGCSGYATISAHGMETVLIPPTITQVYIMADNDHSFTGQKAAFTLARRMDSDNKGIELVMPAKMGLDMNDFPTGTIKWSNNEQR